MSWLPYAILSALFAGLTAVLAKIGVKDVPSTLATAIRTVVILVFAWTIAFARSEHHALRGLSARTWWFLALSGIATGLSWLAYFRALQLGPASRVAPIDKLSLAFTLLLSVTFLHETITWRIAVGALLMMGGALLTL